jgi:hypothetical protein
MSDSVPKSFLYLAREFEEGCARGLMNLSCDIDHWPSLGKPLIGDLTSHRMPGTDLAFRQSLRDNSLEHDYNGSR